MFLRKVLVSNANTREVLKHFCCYYRLFSSDDKQQPSDESNEVDNSYYANYNKLFENYIEFEKQHELKTYTNSKKNKSHCEEIPANKIDKCNAESSQSRNTVFTYEPDGNTKTLSYAKEIQSQALSSRLTHTDKSGELNMVDVGHKVDNIRSAIAFSKIHLGEMTFNLVKSNNMQKGDVLTVAKIAGIMAAKSTSNLIPLCHPIALTKVDVNLELDEREHSVNIYCTGRTLGKTGVEMEALTGASVAALTVYDMCKATNREMVITETKLVKKTGGSRGDYERQESQITSATEGSAE